MKIVGQMTLCNFPLWEKCLSSLSFYVDELYLRFDTLRGDLKILEMLRKTNNCKIKKILESNVFWNKFNWREEMIRMLDDVKPDIVISIDEDEEFEDTIKDEITEFYKSDKVAMMIDYVDPMPTEDKVIVPKYPGKPHMKLYKWKSGLTYVPYRSFARVTNYCDSSYYWFSKTRLLHYCYFNESIRAMKKLEFNRRREFKDLIRPLKK